jgi:hypothetical protein
MIETRGRVRARALATHVSSDYARDRVTRALYEAVLEGLALGPCGLPLAEDREWVRGALAVPLQEATDAAIQVLVRSVGRTLERAPAGLLDRIEFGAPGKPVLDRPVRRPGGRAAR